MGVSHGMCAVLCMQVRLLLVGCGIDGPCFSCGAHMSRRGGRIPCSVTFDPLAVACQEVKGEAMAVNEASVGPEERQGRCEAGVVVRWCCSAHTGNEVSPCVGGVAEGPWRSCVHFGHVEAVWFLWDCLWASGGQSTLCWKWGSLRHRVVLLWAWSGFSLPA